MDTRHGLERLPESHRQDVEKAIEILSEEGCREIYLFGSLINGNASEKSDIDLAVKGLLKGNFFRVLGELLMALNHPVDLVDLEKNNRFAAMLQRKGELLRVA